LLFRFIAAAGVDVTAATVDIAAGTTDVAAGTVDVAAGTVASINITAALLEHCIVTGFSGI